MRRVRKSLLNKSTKSPTEPPFKVAQEGLESNLLGENGADHAQDRYVALANKGDLVLQYDQLPPALREKLEQQLGPLSDRVIGHGGEMSMANQIENGLAIADISILENLTELCMQMHRETAYQRITLDQERLRNFIADQIACPKSAQILIHKSNGNLQGALFLRAEPYFFSKEIIVSDSLFYVYPGQRSWDLTRKFLIAAEVWAHSIGASELCLSVSTGVNANRIGALLERAGFSAMGGVYKKVTKS